MHIEETRGTLKFASRAKCVSNCAQVNEVCVKASKASHSASFIEVSCTLNEVPHRQKWWHGKKFMKREKKWVSSRWNLSYNVSNTMKLGETSIGS